MAQSSKDLYGEFFIEGEANFLSSLRSWGSPFKNAIRAKLSVPILTIIKRSGAFFIAGPTLFFDSYDHGWVGIWQPRLRDLGLLWLVRRRLRHGWARSRMSWGRMARGWEVLGGTMGGTLILDGISWNIRRTKGWIMGSLRRVDGMERSQEDNGYGNQWDKRPHHYIFCPLVSDQMMRCFDL